MLIKIVFLKNLNDILRNTIKRTNNLVHNVNSI